MGTDERPEPNAESGSSTSPARGDIVDTFWDIPPISFDENDGGIAQGDNGTGTVAGGVQSVFPSFDEVLEWPTASAAYRNFCGALDWFSLSVGGVGVSRGGVEFVPVDAGPVCGRDAVVRFGRRCLFALPQGVGDE